MGSTEKETVDSLWDVGWEQWTKSNWDEAEVAWGWNFQRRDSPDWEYTRPRPYTRDGSPLPIEAIGRNSCSDDYEEGYSTSDDPSGPGSRVQQVLYNAEENRFGSEHIPPASSSATASEEGSDNAGGITLGSTETESDSADDLASELQAGCASLKIPVVTGYGRFQDYEMESKGQPSGDYWGE